MISQIDWNKAMNKPEANQKIKNKSLLELRAKINDLEKNISQKKNEIILLNENLSSTIKDFESKLKKSSEESKENEIKLNALNEKTVFLERTLTNKEREIEALKKGNEEIIELKKIISEREEQIKLLQSDIEKINKQFELENKNHAQKIQSKEAEIKKLATEIEQKNKQFENNITQLKELIQQKESKIKNFDKELEVKTNEINDLIKKFKELELKTSDRIKLSTKIIKKIEKIMDQKGFISDKEYDELKKKLIDRQISIEF